MFRQALSGITKRISSAAMMGALVAVALTAQNALAACRGAWAEGTAYNVGDGVTYNGGNYACIQAHTACVGCGWNPQSTPSLWKTGGDCSGGGTTTPPSGGGGGGTTTPPSGTGISAILTEATFNSMFPSRNSFYTYAALVSAANTFSTFATTGDTATRKREVAAFLANIAHETSGLVYIEEIQKAQYCDTSWGPPGCGCAAGKQYYGRGPLQISWNGNYCAAGNALGVDLKSTPELVATNATISWRTALWFWTTQTGAGTMTAHNAIVNGKGFGETIRTINGSLECNGQNTSEMNDRINYYNNFIGKLGTTAVGNNGC